MSLRRVQRAMIRRPAASDRNSPFRPRRLPLFRPMVVETLEDRLCPSAWTSIGPAGAGVWRIAVAPSDPETVYVGTFGGVYKSTDAGANWSDVSSDLGSHVIWSVAVDPDDANTVYAASEDVQTGNNGIYKTTDGGTSWVHVLSGAIANVVR